VRPEGLGEFKKCIRYLPACIIAPQPLRYCASPTFRYDKGNRTFYNRESQILNTDESIVLVDTWFLVYLFLKIQGSVCVLHVVSMSAL
jgi:hypothetical protein